VAKTILRGLTMADVHTETYEAPAVHELGRLHDLTLADCTDKAFGGSDGHTLAQVPIQCSSA
jgi:hypothetical protein